jgi:formamidopyrimidine-DNA glycosylase
MPELPDITVYIEALEQRIQGAALEEARIASPFLLRSVRPAPKELEGRRVVELRRIGKRIAMGFEGGYWAVWHLMIAGRLHWNTKGGKSALASFRFSAGMLSLTEAGSRKRASLNVVDGEAALAALDPGGIDVLGCSLEAFTTALTGSNHTLKRALTDPRKLSGIGNAYSDEILHRAQLSPIAMTQKLKPEEIGRLLVATRESLLEWTERLRVEAAGKFPEKVTAFREGMAVHGRFGEPCPRCGGKVQRIRHADNETNYCPACQTGGRLLADRALSRLLREDWPRSLDEMDELKSSASGRG